MNSALTTKSLTIQRCSSNKSLYTVATGFFSSTLGALRCTRNWILNNYLIFPLTPWKMAYGFEKVFTICRYQKSVFVFPFLIFTSNQLSTDWQKDKALESHTARRHLYIFSFSSRKKIRPLKQIEKIWL